MRDEFLAAGSARVQLPIRIGWEDKFETFLNTKVVPDEKTELELSDEYYSVTDAVMEARGPGKGEPVGEPCYYRLPVAVTILRRDDSLPTWKFNDLKGYSEEI